MNIVESIDGLGMKPCSKCGVPKELSEFYKHKSCKDGCRSVCKSCRAEQGKEWRKANKERCIELNKEYRKANKEREVERVKEYYEANKERKKEYYEANKERVKEYRKANKDREAERGKEYREANKEREAERGKEYRKANKERVAERTKEYYEANKERVKEYRKANKERYAERGKEWRKANSDKRCALENRRRSVKLQAHPPWAATLEKRQIEGIYTLARMQSEATGKEYHVDHIHPLQAPKEVMFEGEMIPLICGLHVPANLQILEASVNCSKSNKFKPYIESECDFTEPWQVRSNDRTLIPTPIDRIPRRYPRAFIKPKNLKHSQKVSLPCFSIRL